MALLAMGSPLSPLLADVFMNSLEEKIFKSPLATQILFWKRYVDDIFGIFKGTLEQLNNLHLYLNSLHPSIKFTLEIETNNSIPFLDLRITRHNNTLKFNTYRKHTTTSRLIPFNSIAPLSHKLAAFRFFFNRLCKLPLDQLAFSQELNTIFYLAKVNNFPFKLINNLFNKIKHSHRITSRNSLSATESNKYMYFSLPYIQTISEMIASQLKRQCPQIQISFTTSSTKLKSVLGNVKDKINPLNSYGIYRLDCPCGKFYIGRTIRNFQIRCKEHLSQISAYQKRGPSSLSSAFSSHVISSEHLHLIDQNFKPQILHKGGNPSFLNSMEILEIVYHKTHSSNILNNITDFEGNRFLPYAIKNIKNI